jgi:photosystem II stability/assembly factor-like uncharacterized protein
MASAAPLRAQFSWQPHSVQTTSDFRGLSVVDRNVIWASGTQGTFIRTTVAGRTWTVAQVPDAATLDFRDIEAFDAKTAYVLSAGPAAASRIYKTTNGGVTWSLQFQNETPEAFFDAIAFWDRDHGMALSDPVQGRFLLLSTSNGGKTWVPIQSEVPAALPGESCFAASGTGLVTQGRSNVWFVTGGGSKARVFRSTDRGQSWAVAETPIVAGAESAGIFSIAFKDSKSGVIIGGDYQKPGAAENNFAITKDGGRTWTLAAGPNGFRSAILWLNPATLLAVGTSGSDVLNRSGAWEKIDEANYNALSVSRHGRRGVWAAGPKGRVVSLKMR